MLAAIAPKEPKARERWFLVLHVFTVIMFALFADRYVMPGLLRWLGLA